jgi:hypothetical protein
MNEKVYTRFGDYNLQYSKMDVHVQDNKEENNSAICGSVYIFLK